MQAILYIYITQALDNNTQQKYDVYIQYIHTSKFLNSACPPNIFGQPPSFPPFSSLWYLYFKQFFFVDQLTIRQSWLDCVFCGLFNIPRRFVTLFAQDELDVDLRTLRAIRVLRPLKLVSGIPSKFHMFSQHRQPTETKFFITKSFLKESRS